MDQNEAIFVDNNNGVTVAQLETGELDGNGELNICNLWSKSLKDVPIFGLNNIEKHTPLSGKSKGLPISKTQCLVRRLADGVPVSSS